MGSLLALLLIAGHGIVTFFTGISAAILAGFLFALGIPFAYKHSHYHHRGNKKIFIFFIATVLVGFIIGRLIFAFFVTQAWFGPLIDMLNVISGLSRDNLQAIILIALLYITISTSYRIALKYSQKRH